METALDKRYKIISTELAGKSSFGVEDIQALFPDIKKSTLYWNISKLVEKGYIEHIRNGVYALGEWKGRRRPSLSANGLEMKGILDEMGFDYYISGLDILETYMQHVPEQYPAIMFVRKESTGEIAEMLKKKQYGVIEPSGLKKVQDRVDLAGNGIKWVVMYSTDNYDNTADGMAEIERAFVDLYYAVTRNGYPLALQELVRIYKNIMRIGRADKKKMIAAATKRSIQYDIRFMTESGHITKYALEFAKLLEGEE